MNFRLHPSVDAAALRTAFGRDKVVSIKPFLVEEDAAALREHIEGRTDWLLRMKGAAPRTFEFPFADLQGWSDKGAAGVRKLVAPRGAEGFCYSYGSILAVDEWAQARELSTPLADLGAFLASEQMTTLIREVTGQPVAYADAFASRYGPDDFLTVHGDRKEGSNRLLAYVIGLTPVWRPEWGGLLLFHEEGGRIRTGFTPDFNVLNLFAVPQDHSVSLVAPFAPVPRLSVTGWFRASQADA